MAQKFVISTKRGRLKVRVKKGRPSTRKLKIYTRKP